MQNSEQIYDEVERRWAADALERKRQLRRRAADVAIAMIPCELVVAFLIVENRFWFLPALGPLLGFAIVQLQQRWQLEHRITELEHKMSERVHQRM